MNRALAITSLIAIGATGYFLGHRAGTPEPIAVENEIAAQIKRPTTELISLLNGSKSEATSYELRRELESLPLAELEATFAKLAEADKADRRLRNGELRLLLHILTARDPNATIALIRKHFKGLKKSHAYYTIINNWGRADPQATLDFLHTLDKNEDSTGNVGNATTGFLYSWAAADPNAALEAWLALPDPKLPTPSTVAYGSECLALGAAQNPEMRQTTLTMLLDQPESEARSSAIAGVLKTWVATAEFNEVSSWFETQQFNSAATGKIAVALATSAAQNGNQTAPDWVLQQLYLQVPDKHDRSNLLANFTEEWTRECPNDCAAWLTKLEPSLERDWAITGFIRRVEYQDPESAFHWTRKLGTPHLRKRVAKEMWNNWRRSAPVAASNFIPNLDANEQNWLRKRK